MAAGRSRQSFFNKTATPTTMSRLHTASYVMQGVSTLTVSFFVENWQRKKAIRQAQASGPANDTSNTYKQHGA